MEEQVVELFQNQRYRKFKGWSSRYLLRSDPGRYSDRSGAVERDRLDAFPPPGWEWADSDTGWQVDKTYAKCDDEGWTYATSFRDFTSSNPGLPAPAEHGTRVRRRRYVRRGVLVDEDEADTSTSGVGSLVGSEGRKSLAISAGTGGSSVGSRGSKRSTGRSSVGFALAPLDEVENLRVEVMVHGESLIVSAGPKDSVRWLQQEASALFSKKHNFSTHIVQVIETYPKDIFQPEAGGPGERAGETAVLPFEPDSLVKKVVVKDRAVFHPAPMEDGVLGVPDAKIWARLQATVTVPPGPLGVVLDGEIGDRPVVLEILGQSGPASTLTSERDAASHTALHTPNSSSTTPRKAKPKLSPKDRAKRLLLGLTSKHHDGHQGSDKPAALTWGGGRGSGGGGSAMSPGGSSAVQVSPLLMASDSATVRTGMVLTSVAARGGQGVSEEAVDTLGMGIKEAIETLVRYQHLHRNVTFVDPPPDASSDKSLDVAGSAVGVKGKGTETTCPFSVVVTVVEASGLKRSDLFTVDPFALVRLGGSSHKTAVRKGSSRPQWGETFKFEVLSLERSLVVQLWDADEIGADTLLGEISVNLNELPVNTPFHPNYPVVDGWYGLQLGQAQSSKDLGGIRLKMVIDQQLYVSIQKKKVDSAARLLQGAMRSFVFRRQTLLSRRGLGGAAPPLPPRKRGLGAAAAGSVTPAGAADDTAAPRLSRQPSRKRSVAGVAGGGWEASGAHAASTLADVFPPEGRTGGSSDEGIGDEGSSFWGASGEAGEAASAVNRGVSAVVNKFLEGPALERFREEGIGGRSSGGLRKSSVGTSFGRRSTASFATEGRRSSTSVRFLEGGRRSSVGGWGEGDEAAKPGTSVCKDCRSDVASLVAVAMAPAEAARNMMEDATHLRYPTVLTESPPPLAVAAFPAPRGGFGPLTVSSCAAFEPLRAADWSEHAAPVLVAPSAKGAAAVAAAAGEVWRAALRDAAAVSSGKVTVGGVVGGMRAGINGAVVGGGGGAVAASSASKASVTVLLKGGGFLRIIPGEEFHYWRWASALSLAVAGGGGGGNVASSPVGSLRSVVREIKVSSERGRSSPTSEKTADAVCALLPQEGMMSWARAPGAPSDKIPLSSVKGLVLSQSHPEACKFLFTVTVVSGCLQGIAEGATTWSGGRLQSYCRIEAGGGKSRTKVATGATPFWNHRCTFAVSEEEALSPGGGARICCLGHRVAYQDTQIGETFIPFSSLTSGKDYTETLDISGNLRRLRLTVHSAKGLVSSDVTGVSDPYCIVVPVLHDGTEVISERGETPWRRPAGLGPNEWQEAFELCRWCAPEDVKSIKVSLMERDVGGRKDEALGEVFIPISRFREPKAKRTKVGMKVTPPPPAAAGHYAKVIGKYAMKTTNLLGGLTNQNQKAGGRDGGTGVLATRDLGTLYVSMSVVEAELPDGSNSRGGIPPGGVKVRCSLDLADEFTCAWPSLLLRHEKKNRDRKEDDGEGDNGGKVEKWRVAVGFGGLVLSKVASGEGAAADSSPFIRVDPSGPADGYAMEVYENQRKAQPWGWGSGRKRHLRISDPGRFSDSKGENRLHVKVLDQAEVPAGWTWSSPEWVVAMADCPRDKDGWTYGKDSSFAPLLLDRSSGSSKELKGSAVRCRRWIRPLQRTGIVSNAPALPRRPIEAEGPAAGTAVDIPDGLRPFCRVERHGRVVALVHENQRYQPGAGWGSTDEDHLLPEDRAPLTGASGSDPIDDLDDIEPSALGPPPYRWEDEGASSNSGGAQEGGWNAGPWIYAETFESLPRDLPRMAPVPSTPHRRSPSGSKPLPPTPQTPTRSSFSRTGGVRSRVWWRTMVVAESGDGRLNRLGAGRGGDRRIARRESAGSVRRKVPHAATPGGAASSRGSGGDRIRVPLDRLRRAAIVGPNTLLVELEGGVFGGVAWRSATLVVGPCDAPRLGSLLVERAATSLPRDSLRGIVGRARRLAIAPPPLPPRPSGKASSKTGGSEWKSEPSRDETHTADGNSMIHHYGIEGGGSAPPLQPKRAPSTGNSFVPTRNEEIAKNPFAVSGGDGVGDARAPPPPPPRPPLRTSQSAEFQEAGFEGVLAAAVSLLQQVARAVAELDDAYNAAYNASAEANGDTWRGDRDGYDNMADLGEAVLWTLWSRLVRLHCYLRQLLAETPAQKLSNGAAAKRGDWSALVESVDAEAKRQRFTALAEVEADAGFGVDDVDDDAAAADHEAPSAKRERSFAASVKAVKGLCNALDRRVTELLLCADTTPESMLNKAIEVVATQCYTKVVDEVGRHVTFRYEGLLPLADQELLALLDILVNKDDLIQRTLQPRLDLVGWRATPVPLLTKAVSVPWLLRAYATSIESKLSSLFRNIVDTNKVTVDFPLENSQSSPAKEEPLPKSPNIRLKLGIGGKGAGAGGGRGGGSGASGNQADQQNGFTMWALHESTAKPLSVVPTTAMGLLDTYIVTVAKRFPDDAGVQAVILRAGAGALGSLRNVIAAHTEAAVSTCPERGWDKLLRFLCATANDCWQLVADALPSVEERHPRAMNEGADESYETLKQLWMMLGVSCCRKAARLVLGFMDSDGLFALEGMHSPGAERTMVEIREALEYYCNNFLRPWMEDYFYQKVLVRLCDHIVVWAAQGLVRTAAAGNPPLDQGQLLRLAACRETIAEALRTCAGGAGGSAGRDSGVVGERGGGGGMYERRLGFLDNLLELIRVPSSELGGLFTGMLQQHIHCQRSVQHALQVVLCLRPDGSSVPESVSKWADEDNWMGGDAVLLSADTAEIEPFHRVFRRPLSALRADPNPLVAPTVLARASDGRRVSSTPMPAIKSAVGEVDGSAGKGTGGVKRALNLVGGGAGSVGGIGLAFAGVEDVKKGMRGGLAKLKKGWRTASGGGAVSKGDGTASVVGIGENAEGPQTVLHVTILEAEGLRNVAVLRKTDSYVSALLETTSGTRGGRTSVKKNTCDPRWNEPLTFQIPTGSLVDAQLHLKVIGKQKLRDDLVLGRMELPLAGVQSAGGRGEAGAGSWFELLDGQGRLKIDAELVTRRPSLIV